jgi:hypothetical protein
MPVICLNDTDKDQIVNMIQRKKWNQTTAAERMLVHRRTIQRVLIEKGLLTYNEKPRKKDSQIFHQKMAENKEIIREVRLRGLNPEKLKTVLDQAVGPVVVTRYGVANG